MHLSAIGNKLVKQLKVPNSVLCFHSLASPTLPSSGSANVSLDLFRSIVAILRGMGSIVPLSELVAREGAGRKTRGLFALTFDDAYSALPRLAGQIFEEEQLSATVFVATDFAARGSSFWWDRVDDLHSRVAHESWQAFETSIGLPEEYRSGQPATHGPLRPLRQWVLREFCGRWPHHLEPMLSQLEQDVGFATYHRSMTFEELDQFTRIAPIDVGVHTLSHPVLPLLSDSEMRREIGESREILEHRYDRICRLLAVPFGLYDARTTVAARACGLNSCLSVANQTLRRSPLAGVLPRFIITAGEKSWKLRVKLTGVLEYFRPTPYAESGGFPALPSSTS